MGNYDWITGTQRFTDTGGVLGRQALPKRVFFVTCKALAGSASTIEIYNGESAASSANIYASIQTAAGSANAVDLGDMYLPNGCYVALGISSTAYAVVQYHEDK